MESTEFVSMGIEGATQPQVRPIPSASGSHLAEAPAMSRMPPLVEGVCSRDSSNNNMDRDTSFFARPGDCFTLAYSDVVMSFILMVVCQLK